MKITNNTNLPQIVDDWAKHDAYDRGSADFTTTELIKPVRILGLERKHYSKMEVDIQELLWRMDGQAKHVIFKMVADLFPERYIAEKRYTMALGGFTLSGQLDCLDLVSKTLHDMKWTKVWKWVGQKKKVPGVDDDEWTQQANINAFLCYHIGNHEIQKLSNIVVFKDWDPRQAMRDPAYYPDKIVEWPLEKWDFNRTLQFIQQRHGSHKKAAEDGSLPLCSPKERWQKPSRWAVMKRGRKIAVKLFDTQVEATAFIEEASDAAVLSVEERPSEDTRCLFHCDVSKYCDHGRKVFAEVMKR